MAWICAGGQRADPSVESALTWSGVQSSECAGRERAQVGRLQLVQLGGGERGDPIGGQGRELSGPGGVQVRGW